MKFLIQLLSGALMLSIAAGSAFAADADKASKQAEVRKATQDALQRFYKANPALQGDVKRAPGYAVFTSYGVSFIIGGAGGSGLTHNNKSGNDTFMNMAQASVGVQIGAAQSETLIIFKSPKALSEFVNKGWEFGGGGAVEAGAGGKTVGVPQGGGENVIADALYYTLTKNGLQAGGAVAGTKFWKSDDLN
ncbi:MAG TPA: YSC84-related protein [Burkholderiales bacterium]|jgi:lipid-binding SYLF domain-containing protein|nr:YSC84-related protein [Burkholderiales bacterium]